MKKLVAVDLSTGEIQDDADVKIYTKEMVEKQESERKRRRDYFRHQEEKQKLHLEVENILGEFYFLHYKRLIEKIDGDTALAFRYLYICTYANDIGKLFYRDKPMKHKDIVRILRMDRKLASSEINRMIELGLLIENQDCYVANLYYYIRNLQMPEQFKGNSSRMFDNGIRELYDISTPRHHAMLGEIVPLLEYINKYNNVICTKSTVAERDFKKLQPLHMSEICKICGRSGTSRTTFKNSLGSFKINGLPLFRSVVEDNKTVGYIINPYILYMGSRNDDLQFAFNLFDLKRRKNQ